MSTLRPTRKISRRHELREDTVVTAYARLLGAIDEHRTYFYAAAAAVVVVVLAFVGYSLMQEANQQKALDEMSGAVAAYEAGSFQTAIDGTASFVGLLDIVDDFGGTDAGDLARFYAASAYFSLGNYDAALPLFRDHSRGGNLLGASAVAGEAAILESQGDNARAGSLYSRAATMYASEATSPGYFLAAGRAYEAADERADARRAYERIRDDYPDSQEARDIDFYLARVTN